MIRAALTVLALFAVAGCAGGDRISLLASPEGKDVGAVALLDGDNAMRDRAGTELVLDTANQEAILSGRVPRVQQRATPREEDVELVGQLPPRAIAYQIVGFATGEAALDERQITEIRRFMCRAQWQPHCGGLIPECSNPATGLGPGCPEPRPGYQIEIRGYTDTTGSVEDNAIDSQRRANAVMGELQRLGYDISDVQAFGMGKGPALRARADDDPPGIADLTADARWRRVDILIR